MKNEKLISVIIPFYNIGVSVEKTIRSLEMQTYKNFEVIFVNDASTDSSLEFVKKFLKPVSFNYKILNQSENKGPSSARNIGLSETHGEYIYFLDADDYICEDTFERVMEMFFSENPDIVIFKFGRVDENHNLLYHYNNFFKDLRKIETSRDVLLKYINLEIFIYTCSVIYKKKSIENIYFNNDYRMFEDQDFNIRVLLNINTVGYINSELISYYKRKGSVTDGRFSLCALEAFDIFYKQFKEKDVELADHFARRRVKQLLKSVKGYIRKVPELSSKEVNKFIKTNILTNERKTYLRNKRETGLSSENIQIFLLRYFPTLFINLFRYNQKRIYK